MSFTKIKLVIVVVLIAEIYAIHNNFSYYPSFRFPAFKNIFTENPAKNSCIQIVDKSDGNTLLLNELVKPYDKRYYWFVSSYAINNTNSITNLERFLNSISVDKTIDIKITVLNEECQ